jgi:hypothetical protein
MVWCLLTPAALCLLLALLTLTFKPSNLRRVRPARAARGCVAGLLVLLAILLAASALALSPQLSALTGG